MDNNKHKFAPFRAMLACGRDFCQHTSMHGFIHIAAPNRWWGERLLWAIATTVAIWGAVKISQGQWQRYNENPTVVALEKDFRSWQFCMPGLTVCEKDKVDEKKLPSVIKKYWGVDPQDEKYARYERFVRDVANSSMLHLTDLLQHEGEDLEVDLYELAVDVLPEFKLKATWPTANLVPEWFPVMTEMGGCYTTNSLAIPEDAIVKLKEPSVNETKIFPLTCKYSSLNCYIHIEVPTPTDFYIHSPYDILNVRAAPFEVGPGLDRTTDLSVLEIGCGRGVRSLKPRRRGCLYIDEPLTKGRQVYSTNSCRRSCRNQKALRDCKCKPFYNHAEDGVACSLRGMRCLAERSLKEAVQASVESARVKAAKRLRAQKVDVEGNTETVAPATAVDGCTCPLMCVDALFEMLSLVTKTLPRNGPFSTHGVSRIKIQAPRTRYTREIVFYFQDLIVSFGGATGLFLGASFISFVEIVFFAAEWLVGARNDDKGTLSVKKTKVSPEQARIQHLNAILKDQRSAPGYWDPHLHI